MKLKDKEVKEVYENCLKKINDELHVNFSQEDITKMKEYIKNTSIYCIDYQKMLKSINYNNRKIDIISVNIENFKNFDNKFILIAKFARNNSDSYFSDYTYYINTNNKNIMIESSKDYFVINGRDLSINEKVELINRLKKFILISKNKNEKLKYFIKKFENE